MICPNCHASNESYVQFCTSCGAQLTLDPVARIRSAREWLGALTGQFLLGLLVIYIIKAILVSLPFIKELTIPDFDLTPIAMIKILVGLVIVFLLVKYVLDIHRLWPQAFTGFNSLADLAITILILILLSTIHSTVKPLFPLFTEDVPELPMIVQLILLLIALFFSARAVIQVYQNLPGWLLSLRQGFSLPPNEPKPEK